MNLAVHGILADGAGSGAGAFPVLLQTLLERGNRVDFFGIRGFTEPKSLERFAGYRFIPLRVPPLQVAWRISRALPTQYPTAACSQFVHVGYQLEAVRRIEAEHRHVHYDVSLCTDAQALWPSTLPVLCWPQSPPHTEGAALRTPDIARMAIHNGGIGRYAAVQIFYAYRSIMARAALRVSDAYLCGSSWAREEWARFGAKPENLHTLAYPIDVDSFARVPPLRSGGETVTFLWLGRAVPRKRLDLFLEAFELLHRRDPRARARLVGNLSDPSAARIVDRYREHPAISIEKVLPRVRVPELFCETDVLVQPSENENFGFSVAEALAAGRPVVVGPTNGTADYVGGAGYSFAQYRADSVANAMEAALDSVVREGPAVSTRAREAARRHFAIDAVADRFSALCSDVLARRTMSV
jgi:glycosyltransferase involved in cell wall biosynthesis